MFKNRFLLVLGLISLMLVSLAISSFRNNASLSEREAAWVIAERRTDAAAPAVVDSISISKRQAAWDFADRHTDWNWSAISEREAAWSLAERHVDGAAPAGVYLDYAQRHPELSATAASIDLTDYYFRHIKNGSLP
jgi:hypothetical protein